MQFQPAKEYILTKLRHELPANLVYHSIDHVIDVCEAAGRIAQLEHVKTSELELLLTAACFHDAGFINTVAGHEEESCVIAQAILPDFGYTAQEIDIICELIRATKLPQTPLNHLEQILADADLDYLGRADFFVISQKLYEELRWAGSIGNEQDWNKAQIIFMEKHHYFTQTAINLRQKGKEDNLQQIKATTILPY
jgi:uncharacterized protein